MAGASDIGCSSGRAVVESFQDAGNAEAAVFVLRDLAAAGYHPQWFAVLPAHLRYARRAVSRRARERSKRPSPVITRSAEAISCSSPRARGEESPSGDELCSQCGFEGVSGASCSSCTGEVRMADDFYPMFQSVLKQRDILSLASFLRARRPQWLLKDREGGSLRHLATRISVS